MDKTWLWVAIAAVLVVLVGSAAIFAFVQFRTRQAKTLTSTGTAAYSKGDFAAAGSSLKQATELDPTDAKAQALYGRSLEAKGDLAGAAKAYTASIKADAKQPEILFRLAVLARASNDLSKSVSLLEQAVAVDETYVAAHLMLAQLYAQQGKKAEARAEYQAVIDLKPLGTDIKAVRKKRDALK